MVRITAFLALFLLAVFGSGCSTLPDVQPTDVQPTNVQPTTKRSQPVAVRDTSAEELKEVVMYFNALSKVPVNDLRREHDAARAAFAANASEANRVRFALVLSFANNSLKDERRALELLEPLARDLRAHYTPLRGFALVVHSLLKEQHKVGANAQALKDKLDALMLLEKSLTERANTAPGAKR